MFSHHSEYDRIQSYPIQSRSFLETNFIEQHIKMPKLTAKSYQNESFRVQHQKESRSSSIQIIDRSTPIHVSTIYETDIFQLFHEKEGKIDIVHFKASNITIGNRQ